MFDGRPHKATPLIYPVHHAPGASHTGLVYSRALNAAYSSAQHNASLVFHQSIPFDMTDLVNWELSEHALNSTSIKPIAEGYRKLYGTHLVAHISYLCWEIGIEGKAVHSFTVVGNSVTTNSSAQAEDVLGGETDLAGRYNLFRELRYYFYSSGRVQRTTIEMELDPAHQGQDCSVQVKGYAYSGSEALAYIPLSVTCFQEVR